MTSMSGGILHALAVMVNLNLNIDFQVVLISSEIFISFGIFTWLF